MAQEIMIIGSSGSGKSTSGRNLNPKSTFWINVLKKPLPFKGWKTNYTEYNPEKKTGNMFSSDDANRIAKAIKHVSQDKPEIKVIVIDDFQAVMSNEYGRRVQESGFKKFQDIFQQITTVINTVKEAREDLTVVFLTHSEVDTDAAGNKVVKAKTVGKAIDTYITLESLFTVVLYTVVKKKGLTNEYLFSTQSDGTNTAKSPMGMFAPEIPNDLVEVIKTIEDYYS